VKITSPKTSPVYVTLRVLDGDRELKPAEVSFDMLSFWEPPHVQSERVEIVIANGDEIQRSLAEVLPHDADATEIPIRLLSVLQER
jgi:hypothetical protein